MFCSDSGGFQPESHFLQNILPPETVCLPLEMFQACSEIVCACASLKTRKVFDKLTIDVTKKIKHF